MAIVVVEGRTKTIESTDRSDDDHDDDGLCQRLIHAHTEHNLPTFHTVKSEKNEDTTVL